MKLTETKHFLAPEVDWQLGIAEIDLCEYLFLADIREVEELSLYLRGEEAKVQAARPRIQSVSGSVLDELLDKARPIETDLSCKAFELLFERDHMIYYSVLNESYGRYPESPEEFTGKLFRTFSHSHLLDYIRRTTNASESWPGPYQHYQIACLNHVAEIISTAPPRIAMAVLGDQKSLH